MAERLNVKKEKQKFSIEEILGAFFMAVITIVISVNVFSRYVINMSLGFTEELSVYLFLCCCMFGTCSACAHGAVLGMDALVKLFPPKVRLVFLWLSAVITVIVFSILGWQGIGIIISQYKWGNRTPMMEMPLWIFTLSVPIGSLLYIIREIQVTVKRSGDFLSKKDGDANG
ncbi:MAG: TRAP transporter small permease [Deltaproteobacteria bacterium]|jgi:TRAP-type C4-dicarboxylate transport system permease small subunit|nr:TRAP transporter small permease [Deltaproteobacteria bacterium]